MEVSISQINCCSCGVIFWVTDKHKSILLETKETFHCPNGHSQSYSGYTEKQKYEKQLKVLGEQNKRLSSRVSETFHEKETLRKSIIGYKGMLGRYKKKVKLNDVVEKEKGK